MCQLPTINPHPLKQQIEKRNIRLWQLTKMLENKPSESVLSRQLNGIRPMPKEIEDSIKRILDELR